MNLAKLFAVASLMVVPVVLQAQSYKLKDLSGEYIVQNYIGGAPNMPTAIVPVQAAAPANTIALAQVDKNGVGSVTYISQSMFLGPMTIPPSIVPTSNIRTLRTAAGAPQFALTIDTYDESLGIGTLTIHDFPTAPYNLNCDFIAQQGSDKKITKLFLNSYNDPQFSGIGSFTAERR